MSVQFESIDGPILYGAAVVDGDTLVMWLRPSIWLAARDPKINDAIHHHGFCGYEEPIWVWQPRGRDDH